MWDKTIVLLIGAVSLVATQGNQYLPPRGAPVPVQDNSYFSAQEVPLDPATKDDKYLPPDEKVTLAPATQDNKYLPPDEDLDVTLEGQSVQNSATVSLGTQTAVEEEHNHHHDDHDHHHEHWDLRESIPGEPGQDYPLHHSPPDTGFSCVGRIPGYYADIKAGCQAFHVCSGDENPPQSFLCPNGTIFHQKVFACEWWVDVDCASSESHFSRNSEIGVVPESNNLHRKPVTQNSGFLSRPIVVAEPDNDINFQSQSSNDVQGSLAYLPPVKDTRKPVVSEYNGSPPVVNTPTSRNPLTPPTKRPTQATAATLPPAVVEQKYNRPAPVLRTTTKTPLPPITLAVQAENAYLPPELPTTAATRRPLVSRTQAPPQPVKTIEKITNNEYLPPKTEQTTTIAPRTTTQRVTTQRVTQPHVTFAAVNPSPQRQAAINTFSPVNQKQHNNGYNFQQPITQGVTIQRITQDPITKSTTFAPTQRATAAAVVNSLNQQTFNQNSFLQNKQQTFSQQNGYNYQKPVVVFSPQTVVPRTTQQIITTQRTTQAPTVKKTVAPVTQRPVVNTFSQANQQTFGQNSFSQVKQQTFSQQNGYNYEKPVVVFSPQTTAAPRTTQQIITTQRVTPAATVKKTVAPVTQRPVVNTFSQANQQTFGQNSFSQVKQQTFSQQNGYNYEKPVVVFSPQTTVAPRTTQQIITTQRVTPAPTVKKTVAPVTQRPVVNTFSQANQQTFGQNSFSQVKQQTFSQQNGYNYEKPVVVFAPQTTVVPRTTQQIITTQRTTPAPTVKKTVAPVTQRPVVNTFSQANQQTFGQNSFSQVKQQTFSQQNGYNYEKPVVVFSPQTTAAPRTTQQIITTQRVTPAATVKKTVAPVTQRPVVNTFSQANQQTFGQNSFSQVKQQTFSQQNGYNYEKPVVVFSPQTTVAPRTTQQIITTQRVTPAPTVKKTVAPVTQRPVVNTFSQANQQTFGQNSFSQVKQQTFSQQNGYNNQKPVVAFSPQTTVAPPTTQQIVTQRPIQQTFGQSSGSFSQVKQQSFSQTNGYSYEKPVVSFSTPTTAAPRTTQPIITTQKPVITSVFTQVREQSFGQNSGSFSQVKQEAFSKTEGYSYRKPAIAFSDESTTVMPPTFVVTTETPNEQPFQHTTTVDSEKPDVVSVQQFTKTEGYSYRAPAIAFPEPSRTVAAHAQSVNGLVSELFTQSPVQDTTNFDLIDVRVSSLDSSSNSSRFHIVSNGNSAHGVKSSGLELKNKNTLTETATTSDHETRSRPLVLDLGSTFTSHGNKQNEHSTFAGHSSTVVQESSSYGFNDNQQGTAFQFRQSSGIPQTHSTFTGHSSTVVQGSSSNGFRDNQQDTAFQFRQSTGTPQTHVSDHTVSIQQNNHVLHQSYVTPLSLIKVATEPCDGSLDPLDELKTPVSFSAPSPFSTKASSSSLATHEGGYHYPKPSIPFITPSNPTLKQASQNAGQHSFANQQGSNGHHFTKTSFEQQSGQLNEHHQSFVNSFKNAASLNTHSFHSGYSSPQQQQKQSVSRDVLLHDVEIVPSISYSYQLNNHKRMAKSA